jgi:hypothetical protein
MKPIPTALILLALTCQVWSQERAYFTKSKLEATATISLNSNGIAYIPAFSLGKPALIGEFHLKKNRFSYDPILAYGMDLKPWIIDNWMHYKLIDKSSFDLIVGGVFSAFFSDYETEDEVIKRAQKYLAAEVITVYYLSPHTSLSVTYLHDRGQDQGTLIGHFINLGAERSDINLGKKALLTAALQVFYIDYSGDNDGFFVSPKLTFTVREIPFSLFFQGIQVIQTNIDPSPGFSWNLGLGYML